MYIPAKEDVMDASLVSKADLKRVVILRAYWLRIQEQEDLPHVFYIDLQREILHFLST